MSNLTDKELITRARLHVVEMATQCSPPKDASMLDTLAARLETAIAERDMLQSQVESGGMLVRLHRQAAGLEQRAEAAEARVAELERAINAGPLTGPMAIEGWSRAAQRYKERAERAEAELMRIYSTDKGGWMAVQRWLDPEGEFDELEDLCRGLDERLERSESEAAKLRERAAELLGKLQRWRIEPWSNWETDESGIDKVRDPRGPWVEFAAVEGYLYAPGSKPGAWQPIETAPKDGRDLLLWLDDSSNTGHWQCDPEDAPGAWHIDGFVWEDAKPTFWMPLPAPPQAETSEAAPAGASDSEGVGDA